ncbi:unnamed protein product [Mortierella alpina]
MAVGLLSQAQGIWPENVISHKAQARRILQSAIPVLAPSVSAHIRSTCHGPFIQSTLALAWSPLKNTAFASASRMATPAAPSTSTSVLCNAVRHMSYKLKTNSSAKKRFVALPSGKFKHWRAGKRHINTGMDRGRLNKAGIASYATPRQSKHLRRLMPYA